MSACARKAVDWALVRDTLDLAELAARLFGPAPGRRGERGRKLWWGCPLGTHEDRNPSFSVDPGKPWWRCYGCGQSGDAVTLVRRLDPAMTFLEAVAVVTGGTTVKVSPRTQPAVKRQPDLMPGPEGMSAADALALVADAARRLWLAEGSDALAYLHNRGLADETIRSARLGWLPRVEARTKDGRSYSASGIVIPWLDGDTPTMIKIRQREGSHPKYTQVFHHRSRHVGIYPDRRVIRAGHPLVITEGELDRLVIAQELGGLAAVATLGSASARPDAGILGSMLAAPVWYVATDGDEAGDRAASGWPARARRVRPPCDHKDWTEAKQAGVNLARWWEEILAGVERPMLYTWPELAAWRWGDAIGDTTPGLDVGSPS